MSARRSASSPVTDPAAALPVVGSRDTRPLPCEVGTAGAPLRYTWAPTLDEELDKRDREAAARYIPEAA